MNYKPALSLKLRGHCPNYLKWSDDGNRLNVWISQARVRCESYLCFLLQVLLVHWQPWLMESTHTKIEVQWVHPDILWSSESWPRQLLWVLWLWEPRSVPDRHHLRTNRHKNSPYLISSWFSSNPFFVFVLYKASMWFFICTISYVLWKQQLAIGWGLGMSNPAHFLFMEAEQESSSSESRNDHGLPPAPAPPRNRCDCWNVVIIACQLTGVFVLSASYTTISPFFPKVASYSMMQCFASWLSMCKVEMALIKISSRN
jgi:hypothetical protein